MKKLTEHFGKLLLAGSLLVASVISYGFITHKSTLSAEANSKKIRICHIPPGNPANQHVISISINALPAHLSHGDIIGCTCPEIKTREIEAVDAGDILVPTGPPR